MSKQRKLGKKSQASKTRKILMECCSTKPSFMSFKSSEQSLLVGLITIHLQANLVLKKYENLLLKNTIGRYSVMMSKTT